MCSHALLLLISCGPKEQKADDAFQRVKAEKLLSNDSSLVQTAMLPKAEKKAPAIRNEVSDERALFQSAVEKRIAINQTAINLLKSSAQSNPRLLKKIAKMEQENTGLKTQMEQYDEKAKLDWLAYKHNIEHDLNKIDFAVKELVSNNQK